MFRIPKGFPGAGRFTDALTYLQYLAEGQFLVEQATREAKQVRGRLRRAKRGDTQNRLTQQLDVIERRLSTLSTGLAEESYRDEPMPPQGRAPDVRRDEVAVGRRSASGDAEWAIVTPETGRRLQAAPTWEFGVSYEARKMTSNVTFNARVSRRDNAFMTQAEAFRVFDYFAQGRDYNASLYDVHTVTWERPHWRTPKDGSINDLASFESIMNVAIAEKTYRLGAVDE